MGAIAQVQCLFCGDEEIPLPALRCGTRPGESMGLCEFTCLFCGRLVRTAASRASAGLEWGASRMSGAIPFELLEPREGPPLTTDEVLDLLADLGEGCCPEEPAA